MIQKNYHVMLIDDDPLETALFRKVLESSCEISIISCIHSIKDARNNLDEKGNLPDLIFLDFRLNGCTAIEFLKYIKSNIELKHIPVIIISGSDSFEDLEASYQHHASCFIRKPANYRDLKSLVKRLIDFWCKEVILYCPRG